jgi:iron complex transport system substrate-binding protein
VSVKVSRILLLSTLIAGASVLALFGSGKSETAADATAKDGSKAGDCPDSVLQIRYARGFKVEYRDNHKIVTVFKPWRGAEADFQYVLVPRGSPRPKAHGKALQIVEVPVRSIVTMSTTYLTHLDMLGVLDRLVGHDSFAHVNNPNVRRLIANKKIKEVGEGSAVNIELLLDMEPDLIMTSSLGGQWDVHSKLEEAGFRVVLNGEYMETSPLGRSEWIKFIALFFNREQEAEHIFEGISRQYEALKEKARGAADRPTVLTEAPYQGSWWVAGGGSYMARFIEDAGARYVWSSDPSTGSRLLDFEAIYAAASEADYWINPGTWRSLSEGLAVDERFVELSAFRRGNVFNNNARTNEYGGNDYWESGVARPYEILADLIRIFHPDLLPDHRLKYYRRLPP